MNDKMLTMSLFLVLIMIGVNAFLLMAATNLYDNNGNEIAIFYGLDNGALGSQLQDDAAGITVSTGSDFSSTAPVVNATIDPPIKSGGNPIGLEFTQYFTIMVAGLELVMLKFSSLFPILAPIINALVFFAAALKIFAMAFLGSQLVRAIVGRVS